MASKYENEKGFLIIEMSLEESRKLNFGVPEGCICMSCNGIIKEPIYYISVLNDCMCKECLDNFLKTATHYKEDEIIEKRYFDYYFNILK